jgi:integrase
MAKLTKRFIDALKPIEGHDAFHWDDGLSGFGVRIKPSSLASYIVQYRTGEGATRRLTLGKVGTVTPHEARALARDALGAVAHGRDPSAERKAARAAVTFDDLVGAYLQSDAWARKSPSTKGVDIGRIDRHLRPLLGKHVITVITRHDIVKVFRAIKDGRTAADMPSGKPHGRIRVTGGEGTARRTIGLAGAMFSFAVKEGWITSNPCQGIDKGRDSQRDTILESAEDYARMFAALARLEAAHTVSSSAAAAIQLLAMTGMRRGEVVGLKWRNIDLTNGRIVLQSHEHKTGRATGRAKIIPLPAMAQEVIASITAGGPDDLVIRSAKDGARIDLKRVWERVRTVAGLPASLTLHGLRHSIASHLAMGGATGPEIMAAMNHANIATSQRYIHFARDRKNVLAERAASVATAGLAASRESEVGEIVTPRFRHAP